MSDHRYNLEPYKGMSTKHQCPACGKPKTFTFYIDNETQLPVGSKVGRCERIDNCGYHYTPKQFFEDSGTQFERVPYTPASTKPIVDSSYLEMSVLRKSLTGYDKNNFITFLKSVFPNETVDSLIERYLIGTSSHWPGSTVFWQVDNNGRVRTGKIMLYNPASGKRVKEPSNHITWAHKALKLNDYNLKQCLFGEHLLKLYPNMPVAVVESEKTAIIASVYLPQFIWVACGSLQNLTADRCAVLANRSVMLYPDLNALDKWAAKAKDMGFNLSTILESRATDEEVKQGLDIADYLMTIKVNPIRPVDPEVLALHRSYQTLEDRNLIPDEYKNYISTLWQGVLIYLNKPLSLKQYIQPLYKLKCEIESK